jgi:hypothetical protein
MCVCVSISLYIYIYSYIYIIYIYIYIYIYISSAFHFVCVSIDIFSYIYKKYIYGKWVSKDVHSILCVFQYSFVCFNIFFFIFSHILKYIYNVHSSMCTCLNIFFLIYTSYIFIEMYYCIFFN